VATMHNVNNFRKHFDVARRFLKLLIKKTPSDHQVFSTISNLENAWWTPFLM
jgi:hypothetical protein